MVEQYVIVKVKTGNIFGRYNIKMEKGCSFENENAIYRMNNDGKLSVFDKSKKQWSTSSSIEMTGSQLDIFKSIANNNNEINDEIVLSKKDIDSALNLYKNGKLTEDLNEHLWFWQKVSDVKTYSKKNGVSAKFDDNSIIFGYGTAKNAEVLSNIVNSQKLEVGKQSDKLNNHAKTQSKNSATSKLKLLPSQELGLTNLAKQMNLTKTELKKKISTVAKETGFTEFFISQLVTRENYEPVCRDTHDGAITGGFGHTNLFDPKGVKLGDKVNIDKAFNWLIQDLKNVENKIKQQKVSDNKTYGNYWNNLPQSIKEAIIDCAFNRDVQNLSMSDEYAPLRANIVAGKSNLPAIAIRIRQNFNQYSHKQKLKNRHTVGLMKRNCYRFLIAVQDLSPSDKAAAKRRFINDNGYNYYQDTLTLLTEKGLPGDTNMLKRDWESVFANN